MEKEEDDPYLILGIAQDATIDEIRARYFQLARQHHPDKHMNLSEEERRQHEETFQKVSAAYQYLQESRKSGDGEEGTAGAGPGSFDWRAIWGRLTSDDFVKKMRDMLQATVQEYFRQNPRTFKTTLTLVDIHRNTPKTYRIWYGKNQPFVFTVTPSEIIASDDWVYIPFPGVEVIATPEQHPVYTVDPMLDGYDLYTTQEISLEEYILGTVRKLPHVESFASGGEDGGMNWSVERPPFWPIDQPVTVEGAGLAKRGDLIVSWTLRLPESKINAVDEFRTILGKLT